MASLLGYFLRKPLERLGLVSPVISQITEEERDLANLAEERLRETIQIFKEHNGFVTQIGNNVIELDHKWHYPLGIDDRFAVGDRVSFRVYKTLDDFIVKDVVLLTHKEQFVTKFVSAKIVRIKGNQFETNQKISFDLGKVRSDFIPVLFDKITLEGEYPKESDDSDNFDLDHTLFVVKRISPSNMKLVTGSVSSWSPEISSGVVGGYVLFHQNVCEKFTPKVGDKVVCNAIQGDYEDNYNWRAANVSLNPVQDMNSKHVFVVGSVPKFSVTLGETKVVDLSISNCGKSSCRIISVKSVTPNNPTTPNTSDPIVIPPQTTITWPVNVVGAKLGSNFVKFQWQIMTHSKKMNVFSSIVYNTLEHNLNSPNGHQPVPAEPIRSYTVPGQNKMSKPIFHRVNLKDYSVPKDLVDTIPLDDKNSKILDLQILLQKLKPALGEGLNETTYGDWMHTMLFLEELDERIGYNALETQAPLYKQREYIAFTFPIDSEYSHIVCGDSIIVSKPWENIYYEGKIWETSSSQLFCKFSSDFEDRVMRQGALYNIKFRMSRTSYRRRHQAIDLVLRHIGGDWLFPSVSCLDETEQDEFDVPTPRFFNRSLNDQQKSAVKNILSRKHLPYPYIIYGPPGTGKTMTIVEVILQVYTTVPNCRILVAAPTNSAIDTMGVRLLNSGVLNKEDIVRMTGYNAYVQGHITTQLLDVTFVPNLGEPSCDSLLPQDSEEPPTLYVNDFGKHKLTMGTLTTLSVLNSAGLARGYFTHLIMDESGQCHEPDTLLPIALIDKTKTQVILAGDPMQLGPVISSNLAKRYNFQISLLDRLTSSVLYRKKYDAFESSCGFNPRLITRLVYNYRSLPQIVKLTGELFYENDLLPVISVNNSREGRVLENLVIHEYELGKNMDSLVFINVDSKEEQIDDNFSWFNSGEVFQVMNVLTCLYEAGVSPDDIGVISPYSLQVQKIHELLDTLGMFSPKVASVEEFQGQERDIIIMSLVRNNRGTSSKVSPFVCDPQRINVALSRAKVLNVIIGNRNTLIPQPMWAKIISKCHLINFLVRDQEGDSK